MADLITYGLTVFMGFFAIMNPIANTPIFLGLVEGEDKASKRKIAKTALLTAFIIVVAFIFAGSIYSNCSELQSQPLRLLVES